jgi:dTDP-glucose pyrophosphorylase
MRLRYPDLIVNKEDTLLIALKKMDLCKRKLLIVLNKDEFVSVISIGDIQRAIIKGIDLKRPVHKVLRSEVTFASSNDDIKQVKEIMRACRTEVMPIVSPEGKLVDVIFWEDLFKEERLTSKSIKLGLPVIIMAGGEGTRLKPLTNILPKPLIPINKITIIEDIMNRFVKCGCKNFFISLNYKAEMIRYYLDSLQNTEYNISYFQEDKPLGTAGSLYLIKDKIFSTFFVTNCDILIEQDYVDILNYHRENKNEITLVAALKTYPIPYGTLSTLKDGLLKEIREKPESIIRINTGFYILEPDLLNEIPDYQFFNITSLISRLQKEKRRIGVFPVSEKSWIDIGNWDEYINLIRQKKGN